MDKPQLVESQNESGLVKPKSLSKNYKGAPDAILIGDSTGGPTALKKLLNDIPKPTPPIIIVQHIADISAKSFANSISQQSGLDIAEPTHGAILKPSHIYLSMGDYHIGIKSDETNLRLTVFEGPPIGYHRPAVNYLFLSASSITNKSIYAFLLTGEGNDGADGLVALKENGAFTACQNQKLCTVGSRTLEGVKSGGASQNLSIDDMRKILTGEGLLNISREVV